MLYLSSTASGAVSKHLSGYHVRAGGSNSVKDKWEFLFTGATTYAISQFKGYFCFQSESPGDIFHARIEHMTINGVQLSKPTACVGINSSSTMRNRPLFEITSSHPGASAGNALSPPMRDFHWGTGNFIHMNTQVRQHFSAFCDNVIAPPAAPTTFWGNIEF